jgi:hypothetical protein
LIWIRDNVLFRTLELFPKFGWESVLWDWERAILNPTLITNNHPPKKKKKIKKKKKKKKSLSAYVDIKRHAEGLAKVKIQIQDVSSEMLIFKLIKYNKYNYLINT